MDTGSEDFYTVRLPEMVIEAHGARNTSGWVTSHDSSPRKFLKYCVLQISEITLFREFTKFIGIFVGKKGQSELKVRM